MKRFLMAVALVAAVVLSIHTWADDKKPAEPKATKLSEQTKEMRLVCSAFAMAAEGRKTKSPEMLLAAARVIGKTDFSKLTEKELAESNNATPVEGKLEAAALIKEATDLGGDNADAVKKMAAAVEADIKSGTRGAKGGPRAFNGKVNKDLHEGDTYLITFVGGDPAQITVNNTTNAGDIDLFVYDKAGKLVAFDRRTDDDCAAMFFPSTTQQYKVVVKCYRSGDRVLQYRLTTN
jgi:hypothetical protein